VITLRFDILAKAIDGTLFGLDVENRTFTGVSIDSRTLVRDNVFVAVKGDVHDGHSFVDQAIAQGAAGLIVDRSFQKPAEVSDSLPIVGVDDTHDALLDLAAWYRNEVAAKRIAITGSNGKTTTKEFTYALLQQVEPTVYRSPGNFNNLYGLPLSLLAMPATAQAAVFELGISVPGEMARLAELIQPAAVVVTNVGASHLEYLGTVEGVAREKLSLVAATASDSPAIVNADSPILLREAQQLRSNLITFGLKPSATFHPDKVEIGTDGVLEVTIEGHRFRIALFGRHQVYNLLAAYAIVRSLGYSFDGVDTSTIAFESAPMRGQVLTEHGVTIIADCYNANPDSVATGLETLKEYPATGRRFIVLGDMLELGDDALRYHHDLGAALTTLDFAEAVFVGPLAKAYQQGAEDAGVDRERLYHVETAQLAADYLTEKLQRGDVLFVKGSRGIGLETIIHTWRDRGGTA